jgi:hypothetical protein
MQKITNYPVLFGVLIALLLAGIIIASVTWFPWLVEAWERHDSLVQAAFFSVGFFGIVLGHRWQLRHRAAFWVLMSILFLLHAAGVFLYTTHIHPLLLWQWFILFFLESLVVVFFVRPSTHWLCRRFARHGQSSTQSD